MILFCRVVDGVVQTTEAWKKSVMGQSVQTTRLTWLSSKPAWQSNLCLRVIWTCCCCQTAWLGYWRTKQLHNTGLVTVKFLVGYSDCLLCVCPGRFCAELISSSFKEYPNRRCIPRQNDFFIFLALYILYISECKLHICPSSLPMTLNCNLTISCRQRRQQHAKVKLIRFYDLLCNNPPKLNQ